ncbi:class I SAM-dependent methyltransferase [bacterium]|nr:class I SAM-dependent methyltransferase [bacterium]
MDFYDSSLAARLFDLQHADDVLLEREREFLLEEIAQTDGPCLDLGCGTGRVLLPALERHLQVDGCDRSHAFLARLRKRAHELGLFPHVWQADLAAPAAPDQRYGLAFAAFRTFDHLVAPGKREESLTQAQHLLKPGGRLLLNLINPEPDDLFDAVGQPYLIREDLLDNETGRVVLWWAVSRYDPDTRIIHETTRYEFLDETGRIADTYCFLLRVRWTPEEEMREMAQRAGFEVSNVWGGFAREQFQLGTGDSVWELRKA